MPCLQIAAILVQDPALAAVPVTAKVTVLAAAKTVVQAAVLEAHQQGDC